MSATAMETLLEKQWHHLPEHEVSELLGTHLETGLTAEESATRLARFGPNEISAQPRQSAWVRFLLQFHQPLIYLLLAATVITALLQEWVDAGVIFGVVLVNAVVGFIQEARAENAIAALARMVTTEAAVVRERRKRRMPSRELTPGDVVILASSDKVPADVRLLKVRDLQVDKSALTGESVPVNKKSQSLPSETLLADRTNMAYAGSLVTYGQGTGVVIAISDATETGRISQLVAQAVELSTPLTRKIREFSHCLLYVILVLAAATFAIGLWRGEAPFAMLMAAVEEGRCVFDNLTKFITWTLPTNGDEVLVIMAAIAAGMALPILPVPILWINMTTALLLGSMLAFEPKEADVMKRPPRNPHAPILSTTLMPRIIIVSALPLAGTFGLFL